MTFREFARIHGLIIRDFEYREDGEWHRVATEDKPGKRNGSYKCDGSVGWVQNHATMSSTDMWREAGDGKARDTKIDHAAIREAQQRAAAETAKRYAAAAQVATKALAQAEMDTHPYLERKGFRAERGLIFRGDLINDGIVNAKVVENSAIMRSNILMIPMRDCRNYQRVQSIQLIDDTGRKIFLPGGASGMGIYRIGEAKQARFRWFCEGYATGLSIHAALTQMRFQCEVICCFSAGNMVKVVEHYTKLAGGKQCGYVFADNDPANEEHPERGEAGQRAAKATGLPWTMPEKIGYDANDVHANVSIHSLAGLIRKVYASA